MLCILSGGNIHKSRKARFICRKGLYISPFTSFFLKDSLQQAATKDPQIGSHKTGRALSNICRETRMSLLKIRPGLSTPAEAGRFLEIPGHSFVFWPAVELSDVLVLFV